MLKDESPMSRFEECGKATSLYDLLALIIGGKDSLTKADGVIRECVAPYGAAAPALSAADWRDFVSAGLTKTAAIKVAAAIELGFRLAHAHDKRILENFSDSGNVAAFFMKQLRNETQEHFFAAFVNVKCRLLGYREISIGGLDAVTVDVKEIMRWAIRYKAHGIILIHNHPSGFSDPSEEDIEITKSIAKAAKFIDCEVLDHVIIGDGFYSSLHDKGII